MSKRSKKPANRAKNSKNKPKKTKFPGYKSLFLNPFFIFKDNFKLYALLTLIYSALVFVFSRGLGSAFNFLDTRQEVFDVLGGEDRGLDTSYILFNYLVSSSNTDVSSAGSVYQLLVFLITVLATIWLTRQIFVGKNPKLKQAYYEGMYPMIPFVLLIFIIALQLIPLAVGNFVFSITVLGGLATTILEQVLWSVFFAITAGLSIYWLLSSIFALNIVSLKGAGPIEALHSSSRLVSNKRLKILAMLLLYAIIVLLLTGIIFVLLISVIPVIVEPIFIIYSGFIIVYTTLFMYNFYRGLLGE